MTLLSKVIEVFCMIVGFGTIMGSLPDHWKVLLGIPCWGLALSICVFVHELGHVAGARIARWHVVVFAVGRFAVQIPNRSFGIVTRKDREEIAGWVLAFPPTRELATVGRALTLTAGGPIANLLFSMVLIPTALNTPQPANDFGTVQLSGLLFALAWLSIGLFFGNTIPHRNGNWRNDGATIIDRIKGNDGSTGITPLTWMLTLLASNVRLRDLPEWMFSEAQVCRDELDPDRRLMATIWIGMVLDARSPDAAEARRLIDDYHKQYSPNHWSVACEAFLAATYEANVVLAKEVLTRVQGLNEVPQLTLAAEAAIAMREGRTQDARRDLKEMDRLVREVTRFTDLTYRDIRTTIMSLHPIMSV